LAREIVLCGVRWSSSLREKRSAAQIPSPSCQLNHRPLENAFAAEYLEEMWAA